MRRIWWWLLMRQRNARLRVAGWIISSLGQTTADRTMLLQIGKQLAELESYIEKSGEIRHRTAAYGKLAQRVQQITGMLDSALRMGDPHQRSEQLQQIWTRARIASMSRNQQRKHQRAVQQQEMRQAVQRMQAATSKPVSYNGGGDE